MMHVKAVIVTYNPSIDRLAANIASLITQVEEVVVVDNHSSNPSDIQLCCASFKVSFIQLPSNQGIAAALNRGIRIYDGDFDWILTLDQDSVIPDHMVREMLSLVESHGDVGIVCPAIVDSRMGVSRKSEVHGAPTFQKVNKCIQSGALFSKKTLERVGPFNEWLFIDYVDFEYCFRTRRLGIEIMQCNATTLDQEFGTLYKSKLFVFWQWLFKATGMRVFNKLMLRPEVNPQRMYYRSRNRIYCFQFFPFVKRLLFTLQTPLLYMKILFRAQQKITTSRMLFRGTLDGVRTLGKTRKNVSAREWTND